MRACGPCQLCCKVMAVEAVAKPLSQWCPRIGPKQRGCSVYDQRPEECRRYNCLWLQGLGPDEHRPDLIHAVASPAKGGAVAIHEDQGHNGAGRAALQPLIALCQRQGRRVFLYAGCDKFELQENGEWRLQSSTNSKTCPL